MKSQFTWNNSSDILTLEYTSTLGDSQMVISSSANEEVDRSLKINISTVSKNISKNIIVNLIGLREYFQCSDGSNFQCSDGLDFIVLK